ncbi:hypothetical protein [Clostridium phage Villandry]|nr:hypothetical protein [Clostridium phage Villandry]
MRKSLIFGVIVTRQFLDFMYFSHNFITLINVNF